MKPKEEVESQDMDLEKITVQLCRMETKLDRALEDIKEHDVDIRDLSKKHWGIAGGLAVLMMAWEAVKYKFTN